MKFKPLLHGFVLCAALLSPLASARAQTALISADTSWRYDDASDTNDMAWHAPGFDDSGWSNGVPLFGADTVTYPWPFRTPFVLGGGRITYYFRTHFTYSGSTAGAMLIASNYIDDGAIFYLNGVEAGRVRLTNAPVLFDSLALNQEAEGVVEVLTLSAASLVAGDNVLAVEVHQTSTNSSDIVFGMTLDATVIAAPVITQQPTNQSVTQGQSATFTVVATGTPPPIYQWQKDGAPIGGATDATLRLTGVNATDDGTYFVRISNLAGSVDSAQVLLTVVPDNSSPTLISAIANCASNKVTATFSERLSVDLQSGGSDALDLFNYQISGGVTVLSATISPDGRTVCLFVDALTPGVFYTLDVSGVGDPFGNLIISTQRNFSCFTGPVITQQPQSQTATEGQSVAFTVGATGELPLTYQWRHNAVAIPGATNSTYSVEASRSTQGVYDVLLSYEADPNALFHAASQLAYFHVRAIGTKVGCLLVTFEAGQGGTTPPGDDLADTLIVGHYPDDYETFYIDRQAANAGNDDRVASDLVAQLKNSQWYRAKRVGDTSVLIYPVNRPHIPGGFGASSLNLVSGCLKGAIQEIDLGTKAGIINFDPASCTGVSALEEGCTPVSPGACDKLFGPVTITLDKGAGLAVFTVTPVAADTDEEVCADMLTALNAGGIYAYAVSETTILVQEDLTALSCTTDASKLIVECYLRCDECLNQGGCLIGLANHPSGAELVDIDPKTGDWKRFHPSNPRRWIRLNSPTGPPLTSFMGLEYFGPGNVLYAVTKNDQPSTDDNGDPVPGLLPNALYQIDRITAVATLVGPLNLIPVGVLGPVEILNGDLTFDSSGTLYGAVNNWLFKISLSTGAAYDALAISPPSVGNGRDIRGLSSSATGFIAVDNGTTPSRISIASDGTVFSSIPLQPWGNVGAMDYDPATQNFFAITDDGSLGLSTLGTLNAGGTINDVGTLGYRLGTLPGPGYFPLGFCGLAVVPCAPAGDLWVADNDDPADPPVDMGIEPNPYPGPMWKSPAIYVRQHQDGLVFGNNIHEDPEYRDPGYGIPNWVYVIVQNRGNVEATGDVEVYASQPSSGSQWPEDWNYSVDPKHPSLVLSEHIGTVHGVTVPPQSSLTAELAWYPRDPAILSYFYPADTNPGHWCLLARLINTTEGITFPEGPSSTENARKNKTIAQRNQIVWNQWEGAKSLSGLFVRNRETNATTTTLRFTAADSGTNSIFNRGVVAVNLGAFHAAWVSNGAQGFGIEMSTNSWLRCLTNGAFVTGVPLPAGALEQVLVAFEPAGTNLLAQVESYELDLRDDRQVNGSNTVAYGGISFRFNVGTQSPAEPCVIITCPTDRVVESRGCASTPVNFNVFAGSDCETNVTLVCMPPSGSLFPMGTTTVSCHAFDGLGHTNRCSFTVTVRDSTPPSLTCPSSLTLTTTSATGTNVTFAVTAEEPCETNAIVACSPPSGSHFPLGTTLVQCVASDSRGNTNTCFFPVTLNRIGAPVITQRSRSQVVTVGANAVLAVAAAGSPPMTYQWFQDELALPGATGPSLALAAVSHANGGYYQVAISNAFGSVTSQPALLRIQNVPSGGDPGGPTDSDFGDLPGPYAACWRYFSYDENCAVQHIDVKVVSSVAVTYPTLRQDNGAQHYFMRDRIWLGTDVSATRNGTPAPDAKLDPLSTPSLSVDRYAVRTEENGIRRVPAFDFDSPPAAGSIADPRLTTRGKQGLNLFGSGCTIPGQQVFFTVEAYNEGSKYCDPFYLNLWIDYGDQTGVGGTPDGKFQAGEYVLVDEPLWGASALSYLEYETTYPYDTSDLNVRLALARYDLDCSTTLPDIGEQPYAAMGLQLFKFTIPPMPLAVCGKEAYARFRISRHPLDVNGVNPYHLQSPPLPAAGTPDPSVGLVDDGGEVEDYAFPISLNCNTGIYGASTLCLLAQSVVSEAHYFDPSLFLSGAAPDCGPVPAPAPVLLGFSSDSDPLTGCEFPVITPVGWCGTGAAVVGVMNSGSNNLSGVTIAYRIPTNGVFLGASASQGTVTQHMGTVTFYLGDINAGESVQIAPHVLPRITATLNHRFTSSADQPLLNGSTAMFDNFVRIVSERRVNTSTSPGGLVISWCCGDGGLEVADQVTGPWTEVPGATSPFNVNLIGSRKFYRVRW